jgi:hypothetical protein
MTLIHWFARTLAHILRIVLREIRVESVLKLVAIESVLKAKEKHIEKHIEKTNKIINRERASTNVWYDRNMFHVYVGANRHHAYNV